jgi:hypothetical protein
MAVGSESLLLTEMDSAFRGVCEGWGQTGLTRL